MTEQRVVFRRETPCLWVVTTDYDGV